MKGSHKKAVHHLKKMKEHHAEAVAHIKALAKHEKMEGKEMKKAKKKGNPY